MNGFKIMADSYRKLADEGKITKEQAEKDCKAFDFLSSCDQDDINNLFDSGAFNEIAKSYMRLAVKELIEEDSEGVTFDFIKSLSLGILLTSL